MAIQIKVDPGNTITQRLLDEGGSLLTIEGTIVDPEPPTEPPTEPPEMLTLLPG